MIEAFGLLDQCADNQAVDAAALAANQVQPLTDETKLMGLVTVSHCFLLFVFLLSYRTHHIRAIDLNDRSRK